MAEMVIGYLEVDLRVGQGRSLKHKRQIINGLKKRIRNRFNVSVAEIDHHQLWQRAALGICCVETSRTRSHRLLQQVVGFIETEGDSSIIDYHIEML